MLNEQDVMKGPPSAASRSNEVVADAENEPVAETNAAAPVAAAHAVASPEAVAIAAAGPVAAAHAVASPEAVAIVGAGPAAEPTSAAAPAVVKNGANQPVVVKKPAAERVVAKKKGAAEPVAAKQAAAEPFAATKIAAEQTVAKQSVAPHLLPPLSVDVVSDAAVFASMRKEWNALVEASDAGTFNSWDWVYPWFRRIGADRELRILTARTSDGQLAGLMPLCIENRRVAGRLVRRLSFLAENHVGSDYLDVVAARGREEEIANAFATYLKDTVAGWDVIDLVDFDEKSITVKILFEVFGKKFDFTLSDRYLCPYDRFQANEPFDAFLKRTARRDNFLRRKKWLEKQPGYRIEKTVDPAELARPMTEFFRLHAARWSGDGGSQGIKGPSVEAFHRDATHLLAEAGKLRMYTMWVEGKAVASVYGIIDRGVFSYFQSGSDPEWKNKSVGLVLVGETFRDAIESGCHTYDFLRGTETYKSDWVSLQRKTVAVRIHAAKGKGAWMTSNEELARKSRNLAKAMMPTNLVEKIRRLRRKRAQI